MNASVPQGGIQGLYRLLCEDPNKARACTEFSGQVRAPGLLCRRGKPLAVFFVQVALYTGLLKGYGAVSCVLWLVFLVGQAEGCIQ